MTISRAQARSELRQLWRPRSLCFMLPLQEGERLAVVGPDLEVGISAAMAGVSTVSVLQKPPSDVDAWGSSEVVVADGPSIPLGSNSCDHAIVPRLDAASKDLSPGELGRIIRPGGSLFLGAPWRLRAPRAPSALSVRSGRRWLRRAGFEDIRAYAVGPSLGQPRYLVPTGAHQALRWYVSAAYLPRGAVGAVAAHALRHAPARVSMLLFPAVGFLARRRSDQPGTP